MVAGLFATLISVHPKKVHGWWIEPSNTLGMSQFGDGGAMGIEACRLLP